jgi:hypothetical protein
VPKDLARALTAVLLQVQRLVFRGRELTDSDVCSLVQLGLADSRAEITLLRRQAPSALP